jgi:hypothetical protein
MQSHTRLPILLLHELAANQAKNFSQEQPA